MNRAQLFQAVRDYLHRTDIDPLLPVWLALTEQRIYWGEQNTEPLRIAAMARRAYMTTYERPADFLQARVVHDDHDPAKPLGLVALETVGQHRRAYAWDGDCIALSPDLDLPVSLHYWARFAPLDADTDTNELLTRAPNVYLSSMLVEAARWSRDDALGAREAANFASAINALHNADKTSRTSGSLLTMRMPR